MSKRSESRQRHATIVDVAQLAGVAVGTVSRYLNGLPVRSANRHPIEQAIKALNFRQSSVATSMKTQSTALVGMMIPTFSEFHGSLYESLARKLRQAGRALLLYSHDRDAVSIARGIEFFRGHRVDAVVTDGDELGRSVLQRSVEDGLVVVLYDHDLPGLVADRVFMDNMKSSQRLVDHLAQMGHRRIATVHGLLENTGGKERLDGYLQSMKAQGLPVVEDYIVPGYWLEEGGYAAIRDLMNLPEPPTALFGANCNMTIGALRWLREHDIDVPSQLSITSFDDVPAFTVHPSGITSVSQPTERFAEAIAQLLDERLSHSGSNQRRSLRIGGNVTLRGSVAQPKG